MDAEGLALSGFAAGFNCLWSSVVLLFIACVLVAGICTGGGDVPVGPPDRAVVSAWWTTPRENSSPLPVPRPPSDRSA